MLDELSVDEIQGWVVAKAMPVADFVEWAGTRALVPLPA
jgi:sensor c-di-GMP phosphodiesterase-like protein